MGTPGLSFCALRAQEETGSWEDRRGKNCKKSGIFHHIYVLCYYVIEVQNLWGQGKKHYMDHDSEVNLHKKISSSRTRTRYAGAYNII